MRKLILLLFLISSLTTVAQTEEIRSFMEELFFNLPSQSSKVAIVKKVNANNYLKKAEVNWLNTTSEIISNEYLSIDGSDNKLYIFFDKENKNVSSYKILLLSERGDSNAHTVINLLRSFEIEEIYETKDEFGKKIETYPIFLKNAAFAFCIVEIWTDIGVSEWDLNKPAIITITYNPKELK